MSDKSLRVALLTTSFPIRVDSVSGVFVQRLIKNFPDYVKTTVITPGDTSLVEPHENDSYKLHCFRYAPRKWQLLAHQPGGIPVALKRSGVMFWVLPVFLLAMFVACLRVARKAEIIHANWSVNGAIAGVVGYILRKPVVTTLRGEDVTRAKNSKVYRYILAWCLRSNYKLVTVSQAIHDHLSREFPGCRHKFSFLPNGVDSELLNNPIVENKVDERGVFKLLTVGSLIPRKGVETIIEALGLLPSSQEFKLSIVGDGPELSSLMQLAKKKSLEDKINFIGHVSPEKIIGHLADADAFVLASYSEGRPNVILESFAAGVPVIASDIEGVRELVQAGEAGEAGEAGFCFKPGDAKELAAKITQLQQSRELQIQFSRQGREFILSNRLLWVNVGQRYADLYEEAIDQKVSVCVD